ncbi:MAG TPA: DUF5666 domain-containing protein [Terriglobales bacterium]|nr:DUF5666 domain-containing protein [Terriglobales bacterium]
MRRTILLALGLAVCVILSACSGSMNSGSSSTSGGIPMTMTIGDTPPSGVAILFFEALVTGASLQPSDASKPAVTVMSNPVEVEFTHLQTDKAFLSLMNVPPDTYNSMTLTFGHAVLTIVNHSGSAIGSCANNTVCELTPSFNPTTATISSTPFPITINPDSVVGVHLDFNVNTSVQSDLSINPMVTVSHLSQRESGDDGMEMENLDEVDGQVTNVTSSQFTLMNERSGQSFTITTDSNTQFEDFDRSGCAASPANISCVQAGQILNVDLSENGSGTMLAKRVEFEENPNHNTIKGTITSVDSTTQFHMVVFNEEPTANGISEGSALTVTIDPNATFQVGREEMGDDGGFNMPGLSFASGSDLMVGQDIQIRPGTVSSSGSTTTVTTDLVRLWPSQITGQVGAVNNDGTFTLIMLSPLFTGATPPATTINVIPLSALNFEDSQGNPVTVGQTLSIKGLLFNTPTAPTLVTRTLREDGD